MSRRRHGESAVSSLTFPFPTRHSAVKSLCHSSRSLERLLEKECAVIMVWLTDYSYSLFCNYNQLVLCFMKVNFFVGSDQRFQDVKGCRGVCFYYYHRKRAFLKRMVYLGEVYV
jgi:hypothetical protein